MQASSGTCRDRSTDNQQHMKSAGRSPAPVPALTRPAGSGLVVRLLRQAPAMVALAAVLAVASPAPSLTAVHAQESAAAAAEKEESGSGRSTLCNVPPTLSGEDSPAEKIKHPRSPGAARCTSRCVSTCVLGGAGAPGIGGPFNTRRPLVVFKDDFRSRQYCLVECSDICNLIKDAEEGE